MKQITMAASLEALTASEQTIGCAGDHLSTELHIALQPELQGDGLTYRLAFCTADGYGCLSNLLTSQNGILVFTLPNVLMVEGQLQVQLIVYQNEVITHTPKSAALTVLPSITASTEIPADYTGLIYPGVGIVSAEIVSGHLMIRYQDGTEQDAGKVASESPDFTLEQNEFWQSLTFPKTSVMRFEGGAQIVAENGLDIQCGTDTPLNLNGIQVSGHQDVGRVEVDRSTTVHATNNLIVETDQGTGVYINGVAIKPFGKMSGLVDPVAYNDAATKGYVDKTVEQYDKRWKPLTDVTIDCDTDQSILMFSLDPSIAQMEDFKLVVVLPLKDGVSSGGFYVKAFLTDEDVSETNTLFSRNAINVSAGGRMMISSYATRVGEDYLYTTDAVYTVTNGAKTPYTALQRYNASLLAKTPCLRVTLTAGKHFEEGTQIILQGR